MSTTSPSKEPRDLRFLILGAGMSGILSGIELQKAGLNDFAIYEKADRLGGTWRENRYPGVACDVPSHLYSYSFAPNPEWSHRFAPGSEIQTYFETVAEKYGIDQRIQFGKEITRCEFEDGRWRIGFTDGTRDEGDIIIAATGVLHHPSYPEIEELDSFEGETFHSARWDGDVPLAGKRIGVIGTGSTAIQITSALVPEVAGLTLFQRTAQWVMPQNNPAYTDDEKSEFGQHPETLESLRADISQMFAEGFSNAVVDANSPLLVTIEAACRQNLEENVKDPILREKLRPDYRAACKRLIMSEDFYDAIQQPNAELVTEGIERIENAGVRTSDGKLHELDVLVLATGFRVDRFMRPIDVIGRGGVRLEDVWSERPSAYMAISIPDFPNLFMLNGPNGPVGNFSLIEVAELQFAYIMKLVELIRTRRCTEVSASQQATDRFDADRVEAAKKTIWHSGCQSWYLDDRGVPAAWPWTFHRFREEMETPRFAEYELC
ncbi:MAG: NAD(P)/FAD-dependent oxidoreductase [bacterium]|nr:NAD(P)/FAD-dependent oxidoreductase [bacterium]MCP5068693.1 NAD(P)/FAD-dependent oxidoreductase [bacterium]